MRVKQMHDAKEALAALALVDARTVIAVWATQNDQVGPLVRELELVNGDRRRAVH